MKALKGRLILVCCFFASSVSAQNDSLNTKFSIHGTAGVSYEGYGLDLTPGPPTPRFYNARRPWNVVRFNFNPVVKMGKWTIPANFNFSPMQTNFTTPAVPGRQSFWQFLTNPMNNFGINPTLGKTELLLGTQYIKYSDLSTGDLGIFGAGANLSPGKFRIKAFAGVSQRPINYLAPGFGPIGTAGAYQRNHYMLQLGLEKEAKYFVGFNFVKSKDKAGSVSPSPLPPLLSPLQPMDNMIVSFVAKTQTKKGWLYNVEVGQSFYTRNQNAAPVVSPYKDFKPFINQNISTTRDNAISTGIVKKGKDWEIGGKMSYYGAGYYTAGYNFLANDRLEYLMNTKFNAFKKKTNVVAAIGQRFGNWNYTSGPNRTRQIIANANVFSQFNEHFTLNISFNNFGFNAPSLTGYKSVSNELSANPTYTWTTKTMSHLISGTYTWSKYDETTYPGPVLSQNNTQTALLLYVPTFFNKKISPDFSVMWFENSSKPTLVDINLWSFSAGLGWKLNKKLNLKGQLSYNISSISPFTADKNLLATAGFDWKLTKKLSWRASMSGNMFRYGSSLLGTSLLPPYSGMPHYLESSLRTGLQYKF